MAVRKRKNGTYEAVVAAGKDPVTGKRRFLTATAGKYAEAKRLEAKLTERRDNGIGITAESKITVGAWLNRWLPEHAERKQLAPGTRKGYETLIRSHVIPAIGSIALTKLKPMDVHSCYIAIAAKKVSGSTVRQAHIVLRQALEHARRMDLISSNPADRVEAPVQGKAIKAILDLDSVREVMEAADRTPYGAFFRTLVETGLRRGELAGLRWSDLDLDGAILTVRQAIQRRGGIQGPIVRVPKTSRSVRQILLLPETVERLRRHKAAQLEHRVALGPLYNNQDLVFPSEIGTPLHDSTIYDAWAKIREAVGMPTIRPHDLRHAHASLLAQAGVHAKIISERLGHSSIGVTMDLYTHVLPGMQSDAMERLGKVMNG